MENEALSIETEEGRAQKVNGRTDGQHLVYPDCVTITINPVAQQGLRSYGRFWN